MVAPAPVRVASADCSSGSAAIRFSASASSNSALSLSIARCSSSTLSLSLPKPGPATSAPNARPVKSMSCARRHISSGWPLSYASGASGKPMVTRPAPACRAVRAARIGAPDMPVAPPSTATLP